MRERLIERQGRGMNERPHKKLKLWEKVMSVVEDVYRITDTFPKQDLYGLTMQMRRAAVSIASNIAEGAARRGKQEKVQFFTISRGSLSELDAQLEISARLAFIKQGDYATLQPKIDEVSRMLQGLIGAYRQPTTVDPMMRLCYGCHRWQSVFLANSIT